MPKTVTGVFTGEPIVVIPFKPSVLSVFNVTAIAGKVTLILGTISSTDFTSVVDYVYLC